jgi:ketosteroid isomerase-like protein
MKGDEMGEAREVMDRVTDGLVNSDVEAMRALYAPDATAETPDEGVLRGADAIAGWLGKFSEAFPDAKFEMMSAHEDGDTAIDEGYFTGTNTGPLPLPDGQSIPATGRKVRIRSCDLATVKDGLVTSHRFYYDQVEFMEQLGLAPEG